MFSIPPARAIVSRADSSAIWPSRAFDLKAGKVSAKEISRAVIYGSVMGSFCCEKFGVDRFRTLTRKDIDKRFQEFRDFTEF